jgi:hypothetical protein
MERKNSKIMEEEGEVWDKKNIKYMNEKLRET